MDTLRVVVEQAPPDDSRMSAALRLVLQAAERETSESKPKETLNKQ